MNGLHTTRRIYGMTLIELMISMTIGLFILLALSSVYIGSKNTYRTGRAVTNLDDLARITVYRLANEIRHAGYLGNLDEAMYIDGRKGSSNQLADLSGADHCGDRWHIDLARRIEAHNGSSLLSSSTSPSSDCLHGLNPQHTHVAGSDVLVIRRVSEITQSDSEVETGSDNAGRIFVRADHGNGELVIGGNTLPTLGYDSNTENRELVTEAFFLSPEIGGEIPYLRRLYLTTLSGNPALRSERIAPNVVDFQLRFGEDTSSPPDRLADRYVEPGDANPARISSVQFWLLFRSEQREGDYQSPASYTLADHDYSVPDEYRNHRHLLVTQTVKLRN